MRSRFALLIFAALFFIVSQFPPPVLAVTVTQPIKCSMAEGAPTVTISLSGGAINPTTDLCDGTTRLFTVNPLSTITAKVPLATSTDEWAFATGLFTDTHNTCASGTCAIYTTPAVYDILNNTLLMFPKNPTTWDHAYTEPIYGTFLGAFGQVCSNSLPNGGGVVKCLGYLSDYNQPLYWQDSWLKSGSIAKYWVLNSFGFPRGVTPTTGGNTYNGTYIQRNSLFENFSTISAQPASFLQNISNSLVSIIQQPAGYLISIEEDICPIIQQNIGWGVAKTEGGLGLIQGNHTDGNFVPPSSTGSDSTTQYNTGPPGPGTGGCLGTILVIPCTWFQLQCWWYPSLLLGLYSTIPTMMAVRANASGKATAFIFMSMLSLGSLILVLMEMMPIAFPFLTVILTTIYTVRWGRS